MSCNPPSYRFCPCCGGELAVEPGAGRDRLVCRACRRVLYINPAVGVAVVVRRGGEILWGRRQADPTGTPGVFPAATWNGAKRSGPRRPGNSGRRPASWWNWGGAGGARQLSRPGAPHRGYLVRRAGGGRACSRPGTTWARRAFFPCRPRPAPGLSHRRTPGAGGTAPGGQTGPDLIPDSVLARLLTASYYSHAKVMGGLSARSKTAQEFASKDYLR